MEAINSLASTAAKTIWGEGQKQGEEPVSGKQGDTSKGEPYDAGNMEPSETSKDTTSTTKTDGPNPAEVKDSSNMPGDSTKAQNDTRSPEEAEIPAEKLKGPGPRPVAELAKEHHGDAGAVSKKDSSDSGMLDGSDVPAAKPAESKSDRGVADGEKTEKTDHAETEKADDKNKKEKDGSGEQYVKSSGLVADGGDFDASNPGAGREADRLLEEKGIHPTSGKKPEPAPEATTNGKSASPERASTSPERKEKKSLGERIKAKLHHKSDKGVTA